MTQATSAVTDELIGMGRRLSYDDLPPGVRTAAKHCLLDWIGVTVAGARTDAAALLRAHLLESGGRPVATLVGTASRSSMRSAAEANGTAAHALDFDDLHVPAHLPNGAIGHPTAPVAGALLPLAETKGLSGPAFMTALVAGIEIECRIGLLLAPGHYAAGWHSTATIGTFGAGAACAHALKLTDPQWRYMLGLAGMQAQGLKSSFGTMSKPFQVGKAASNGLESALLAASGFTSNQHILEPGQDFPHVFSPTYQRVMPAGYEILNVRFKKYACCGGTHPTIEAVLALVRRHQLRPDQVKDLLVQVHPARDSVCNIQQPRTPLEGKFSLRFVAALALMGSDLGPEAFCEANLRDRRLLAVLSRIRVELAETVEPTSSRVTVELSDGRKHSASASEDDPEADKASEWTDLRRKCQRLASPIIGNDRTQRLIELVAQLEAVRSMDEITACLRPAHPVPS